MNRLEIKKRILDGINDKADSPVFFTDEQLDELIDEGMEIIVGETRSVHRSVLVPIKPGKHYIYIPALAPDFMMATRIWSNSRNRRLITTSIDNLSKYHQRWPTVTGDPEFWFPVSWDIFGLFPRPINGGGVLRFDYQAWPRHLLDDQDIPELHETTQDALVNFGVYMGSLKKWDSKQALQEFQNFSKSETFASGRSNFARAKMRDFNRSGPPARSDIVTR